MRASCSQLPRHFSYSHRRLHEAPDLDCVRYSNCFQPMKAAADRASALRTIGVTAENAGLHPRPQIRREVRRHRRKHALARLRRRRLHGLRNAGIHEQLGIIRLQAAQLSGYELPLLGAQHLRSLLAFLRSVKTRPHASNLGPCIPKSEVLLQIVAPLQHRPGNRPMDSDLAPADVFQDALIGRGMATDIMMLRQAVDRDRNANITDRHPLARNWNHRAGHDHGIDVHPAQDRQQAAQFAMAHERLAAHKR